MRQNLPTLPTIGARFKWAREACGMSQEELAKVVGVEQTSVSTIERDKVANPRKLEKYAAALGVPAPWLKFGIANLERLSQQDVEAASKLADLSPQDRATVLTLIDALSRK